MIMPNMLIIVCFALIAGWMTGDAIKDFQTKRYFFFGFDVAFAIAAYIFMIVNILRM